MFCALTSAQNINLVRDPSFEVLTGVNSGLATDDLVYWKNLDITKPNYNWTSYCNTNYLASYNMPLSTNFFQYPKGGGGSILLLNQFIISGPIKRGITRSKLKAKLIAGKTYCVKIHAVFGERYAPYVTDGLQLYFDNGQLDTMISLHNDSTGIYPQVVPQVSLNNVLTDTMNWNLVMGSFVANGTEEFLTIGNFKINDSITRIPIDPTSLNPCSCTDLLLDDVSVYPIDLANWLPPTYGCAIGDTATIGLPNYETPDAKWYTYNMVLIDSGSRIKVKPVANGTKYICGIDMCNTMVFDTVEVRWWPLAMSNEQLAMNNLRVYPNPASDVIQVSNIMGDKIALYNAVGQLVQQAVVVQSKAEMQVAELPKGLYFVKAMGQMVKVVVQ